MTEISEHNPRYLIDPVAFFAALFGGPILFTLATFWLLYIPVLALGFGGIPYLVVGTPVLLIYMPRHRVDAGSIAALAFTSFVFAWLICVVVLSIVAGPEVAVFGVWFLIFGAMFSTCWGACFGWLYPALAREFYTQAQPA